jgi:hypothetical protein
MRGTGETRASAELGARSAERERRRKGGAEEGEVGRSQWGNERGNGKKILRKKIRKRPLHAHVFALHLFAFILAPGNCRSAELGARSGKRTPNAQRLFRMTKLKS